VYYAFNTQTRRFESLKTKDKDAAQRLIVAMNEACKLPAMNLETKQSLREMRHCEGSNRKSS